MPRIHRYDDAAALAGDEYLVLAQKSATVTITATTISAAAADNSFNDSANGLGIFAAGMAVIVEGFTGDTVNNIISGVITTASVGTIIIGGTDGDVIVDDAAGESVTITAWETRKALTQDVADLAGGGGGGGGGTESLVIAASDETTALTTGTAKTTFRMPYAFTVSAVRASLTTAQASGSIFTVDIKEGVTTILSTNLTIDNTEKTSTTATTPAVISDSALADDAEVTIDIVQVGDGTAKGLKVYLIGSQT